MDKPSILIAQSGEDFRQALERALRDRCRVHVCATGREALNLIPKLCPDILVLDLMLPEMDGLSLLQILAPEGLPMVLATTSLISPYIQDTAQSLGIDYIMRTPCAVEAVIMRVEDMAKQSYDIKARAVEVLRVLGFNPMQNGTKCLPDTISIYAKNPKQALTKELYPAVGKICEPRATGEKIEKDIRYAIKTAWKCRDTEVWWKYFPGDTRPTNGEFIERIVEVVKQKRTKMEFTR